MTDVNIQPAAEYHKSGRVRLVAFDLDDTLAESKAPLRPPMGEVLADLLDVVPVCIISGGRFLQFDAQVLANLPARSRLDQLHLMPTCGTAYVLHREGHWTEVYSEGLSEDEKRRSIESLERRAKQLGYWEPDEVVNGSRIEDRTSQITFSALGQSAAVADKKAWDSGGSKRLALRAAVAEDLPDLEVRAGGSTSIDITRKGIDKAYGIKALAEQTGIALDQMLFVGDRLDPNGNDYPVAALGVACVAVTGPDETEAFLRRLIPQLAADNNQSPQGAPMNDASQLVLSDAFLEIAACPSCHSRFAVDFEANELVCTNAECGLAYPVRDGIPVLLIDEARKTGR